MRVVEPRLDGLRVDPRPSHHGTRHVPRSVEAERGKPAGFARPVPRLLREGAKDLAVPGDHPRVVPAPEWPIDDAEVPDEVGERRVTGIR